MYFCAVNFDVFSVNYYFNQPWFPYLFAVVLAAPLLYLLRLFVFEYIKMKDKELKMLQVKGNSENKSQSYERMMLFLERIKPSNLVKRFDASLAPHEFIYLTEKALAEEFEYNASQQLYLTKTSWQAVSDSKTEIQRLLRSTYEELNENASLDDFKTVFLMNYMNGADVIALAMEHLRKEIVLLT